jgi:hypothetical protein
VLPQKEEENGLIRESIEGLKGQLVGAEMEQQS